MEEKIKKKFHPKIVANFPEMAPKNNRIIEEMDCKKANCTKVNLLLHNELIKLIIARLHIAEQNTSKKFIHSKVKLSAPK